MMRALIFSLMLALSTARATGADAVLDAAQQQRYDDFTHRLRCLVCQNETIADSTAPLAGDLRGQVRTQILAGRSDEDITEYLTDRYGDFVLYRPQFKASTVLLWLGPGLLLLFGLVAALRFLRRPRIAAAPAAVDEAALKRLLDEQP